MTRTALTVAGFDPCGGAGLQADLKTFQAHGVYGLSAATAITIQNTLGVRAVYPLPAKKLKEQLYNLLDDFNINAIKIGMIGSLENAKVIEKFIHDSGIERVVLDPVVKSQSGYVLTDEPSVEYLKEKLLPLSLIVTPNTDEAAQICGFDVTSRELMQKSAASIRKMGIAYVLIKGGHLEGDNSIDLLFDGKNHAFRVWTKIPGPSPHGTGCILAAAIASNLALDLPVPKSVVLAQDYLHSLRRHIVKLGEGYPVLFKPN